MSALHNLLSRAICQFLEVPFSFLLGVDGKSRRKKKRIDKGSLKFATKLTTRLGEFGFLNA
jgi:hypothetical protein